MMSLKEVNALSHYTDWTVGHVTPARWAGWRDFLRLAVSHDAQAVGYQVTAAGCECTSGWPLRHRAVHRAMWISGITQGLMWRALTSFGNLQYSFAESVAAMMPFYAMRAIGGMFFLTGTVLMAFNMFMTIRQGKRESAALDAKLAAKMAHA